MPEDLTSATDLIVTSGVPTIYPVILAGGSGTRLWPLSRTAYPKQLLPLRSERSLLQDSLRRVADTSRFGRPLILASEEHRFIIADQLRQSGISPLAILLEPAARNTAPAAAAAALWLQARDPDALMLVMPSDHEIADPASFLAAIAAGAAATGRLITFGITADRPETGYGYIRRGSPIGEGGVYALDAFVEKPDQARAEAYLADGRYSWNSGIFLFPVGLYLAELERRLPDTMKAVRASVEQATTDHDVLRLDPAAFRAAANLSIDYAVMEHTTRAAVVPVSMGWSDIGSWDALWAIAEKSDADNNVLTGDIVAVDCHNSYLRAEEGLLAAVGLQDLVVVAAGDAIMIAPMNRAQEVKRLVDQLRSTDRPETSQHSTVHRPWGTYRAIHAADRVQVKHIMVKPGGKLSLQMHHHRAEHWIVVSGTAKIVRGDEELLLSENQSTYIPLGALHRLENPGRIPLHLIEVQSGSYLGEDDIVRFEDTYGRV